VTVAILASAPAGTVSPITLDDSRQGWLDAHNNNLSVTATPAGSVTVGGNLSVHEAQFILSRLPESDLRGWYPDRLADQVRMVQELVLAENTRYRHAGFEGTRPTLRNDFSRM
jgi:hypothetical protein